MPLCGIAQLTGKVIAVTDGDIFTLLTPGKQRVTIRLFGIDCPENGQDYGKQSREYLGDLIFFDTVKVLSKGSDEQGRTLGIVTVLNTNVNERMLQRGLAWHDIKYDSTRLWSDYEKKARQFKKGLWASPNPVPPWQWRSTHPN